MRSNAKKVFGKLERKLQQAVSDAPMILGQAGQSFFLKNFEKQGYGDEQTRQHWKNRKKETRRSRGKKILVGTGQLRRAWGTSLRQANQRRVVWNVRLPYAQIHNEGGRIFRRGKKVGAYTVNIPARPVGRAGYIFSRYLRKKYENIFKQYLRYLK